MSERAILRFCTFDELSARALHDLLKLRFDIFVLEQASLYPEIDGADPAALHLLASLPDRPEPIGTLRLLGLDGQGPVTLGRVAVRADHRGKGIAHQMIEAALTRLGRDAPSRPQRLGAQTHLEAFYAGFGFRVISDIYDDGGIPHVDMERHGERLG